MNKFKKFFLSITLLCVTFIAATGGQAYASRNSFLQGIITVTPGDADAKTFELNGPFNIATLSPMKGYLILTVGESEELTITLKPTIWKVNFDGELSYALVGFGLSPIPFFYQFDETPFSITQTIPIDSPYGFAVVGVIIMSYKNVDLPALFTITVSLSEPPAEEIN